MNFREIFEFDGKTALVVGASLGGIGTAIAQAFKSCGASVVITGLEAAPVGDILSLYKYVSLDVTDTKAVQALSAEMPKLDILVNCAGVSGRGQEADIELFQRVVDINLTGTYRTCCAFQKQLSEARGCIINIGSMYGHLGSPKVLGYGAGKAGVHQLTKSLAIAWAESGIRVNAIAPGFIATPGTEVGRSDPAHYKAVVDRTPVGRWGESNDIAGPALFLASPAANFVTGVTLNVDGGYMAV